MQISDHPDCARSILPWHLQAIACCYFITRCRSWRDKRQPRHSHRDGKAPVDHHTHKSHSCLAFALVVSSCHVQGDGSSSAVSAKLSSSHELLVLCLHLLLPLSTPSSAKRRLLFRVFGSLMMHLATLELLWCQKACTLLQTHFC